MASTEFDRCMTVAFQLTPNPIPILLTLWPPIGVINETKHHHHHRLRHHSAVLTCLLTWNGVIGTASASLLYHHKWEKIFSDGTPPLLPPPVRSEVNDSSLAGIDQFHHHVCAAWAPGLHSPYFLPLNYLPSYPAHPPLSQAEGNGAWGSPKWTLDVTKHLLSLRALKLKEKKSPSFKAIERIICFYEGCCHIQLSTLKRGSTGCIQIIFTTYKSLLKGMGGQGREGSTFFPCPVKD